MTLCTWLALSALALSLLGAVMGARRALRPTHPIGAHTYQAPRRIH